MSKRVKLLITAMSAATCMSATTFADDTTEILNGQINLGAAINAVAETDVEQATATTMTAIGMANAATFDLIAPHDIETSQTFSGNVASVATTMADRIDGMATTTAVGLGNSTSALVDGGMTVNSSQEALDGSSVSAQANLDVSSYVMHSVTTANAAANAFESIAYGGEANLDLRQDSGASVTADAFVLAPDGGLGDSAVAVGAANGNSVSVEGYMGPSQIVTVDQVNRGDVSGRAIMSAGGGSVGQQAVASANGNSVRVQNENGYAHLQGDQVNDGTVTAEAQILVGNFDVDTLSASAEGVGNSAVLSNIGADAFMGLTQTNNGTVNVSASLNGDMGGQGALYASAYGNAATSYICSECPVTSYGDMNQTNNAAVSSNVTGQMTTGSTISGTATAIGNSSTYQTINPYQ